MVNFSEVKSQYVRQLSIIGYRVIERLCNGAKMKIDVLRIQYTGAQWAIEPTGGAEIQQINFDIFASLLALNYSIILPDNNDLHICLTKGQGVLKY